MTRAFFLPPAPGGGPGIKAGEKAMISAELQKSLEALAGAYPMRASALIPALDAVQRANDNFLSRDDVRSVASLLGVSCSRAWGAATFYTLLNTRKRPGKWHLQVDTNVPALLMGADKVLAACEEKLGIRVGQTTPDGQFTLSSVEDLGSCATCPVIQVNDTYYENMTPERACALIDSLRNGTAPDPGPSCACAWSTSCDVLLHNRGEPDARSLQTCTARGGYEGLRKALAMSPSEAHDMVKRAIVRGRGGAGFPAGMKWGFLARDGSKPVYLICNADEGEPGTFKDRQIIEFDPHLLIEGMAITAHCIGARTAFIYLRGEYRWIARILNQAIAEARAAGLLKHVEIIVHLGAGSYVCGDETALIESLEGRRGQPRRKPPFFPAAMGLYGCPTVVNNVETLACIPFVFRKGPEAFKKMGVVGNAGPKLFCVSGHVNRPGVFEFELGTPLAALLEAAGGVKGRLKAVIAGGLSVPILTAAECADLRMDYDSCLKKGTMLGSGGVIVLNDTVSIPKLALRTIEFYAHESCGQCTPCREGSAALAELLRKIVNGRGSRSDVARASEICSRTRGLTLCPLGDAFAMAVEAMISKFTEEFYSHASG